MACKANLSEQINFMDPIDKLIKNINYQFKNKDLLLEACTHKSYIAEQKSTVPDNQRLEYLGDAVIQIIVTTYLYEKYPEYTEGKLTKLRATITRQESLVEFANAIELGPCLRLGKGEFISDGQNRPSNLCDIFEALIGAIYLDQEHSLEVSTKLLYELIEKHIDDVEKRLQNDNPKGTLQEWVQEKYQGKPLYKTLSITGPDHKRQYTVAVMVDGKEKGQGVASKLRTAEQNAAREAIQNLIEAGEF